MSVALNTDDETKITGWIDALQAYDIPPRFFLPASTFRHDMATVFRKHLADSPSEELASQVLRETTLWSNPDYIFFDCRASFNRFGTHVFDVKAKQTYAVKERGAGGLDEGIEEGVLHSHRVLPNYLIQSQGYRAGLNESPVRLQCRSINLTVWYEQHIREPADDGDRSTDMDAWLGHDVIGLAKSPNAHGSWVPYVRNLIGLTETPNSTGPVTPVELRLSSLIVLFLKCSNRDTKSFPSVRDGCWTLPPIEGNQGRDEHLFYNATNEVTVTVI